MIPASVLSGVRIHDRKFAGCCYLPSVQNEHLDSLCSQEVADDLIEWTATEKL